MSTTNRGQLATSGNSNGSQNKNNDENAESIIPTVPVKPIGIAKNVSNGKYVFPDIKKEDIWNARMFLKYYGVRDFLDKFLPNELNSLYLYFLIKLLGFESKDRLLVKLVQENVEEKIMPGFEYTYTSIDDPLEKKYTIRLIKDLQKAMNKILSTRMRLLNFYTIDHFATRLLRAKNIIVLTGAGVSTSLGIPDFRSSEGFYSQIKHLGLDDPQDVFNYEIFMKDPSIFYSIANMVLPAKHNWSLLHSFIAMLSQKGKLLRNYTQNIDNLEAYAGIPKAKLVQCHGSFATASCVTCHWSLPGEKIFDNIKRVELPLCPHCYKKRKQLMTAFKRRQEGIIESHDEDDWDPKMDESTIKSYGVLKPDITFFGEALPSKFHRSLKEDISKCDMLICIGTSLKVAPVSEIVNMVPARAPQILINRAPVKHAIFDLSLLGFCDGIAALVTKKCGWEIEHSDWKTYANKNYQLEEREKGTYDVITSA